MKPAKSVYFVAAAISSRVRDGSISSSVSASTDPSKCTCNSARFTTLVIITSVTALLTDYELYLHGEGTNHESYRTLGAHLLTVDDRAGVRFAVWAPNARE